MTVRDRRSRWIKRGILPAAFVAISGIGVAFAFIMPASADTFIGIGVGATPEEAIQAANNSCVGQGMLPGPIMEQKNRPEGGWEVTVKCFESPIEEDSP